MQSKVVDTSYDAYIKVGSFFKDNIIKYKCKIKIHLLVTGRENYGIRFIDIGRVKANPCRLRSK